MKSPRFGKRNLKRRLQKSAFPALFVAGAALSGPVAWAIANVPFPFVSVAQAANSLAPEMDYLRLATVFGDASIVAHVRIRKLLWIREQNAIVSPAAPRRALVTADVVTLLRAPAPLAPRIRFLIDLPDKASGGNRIGTAQKEIMISARLTGNQNDEVQLLSHNAPPIWSEPLENRIRAIVGQFSSSGAPSAITGIAGAFHAPGSLIGESDTQIFMDTASGTPMSIFVVRRADSAPRWGAAFGDAVDREAPPPQPDTVGWFRLVCGLPSAMPARIFNQTNLDDRERITHDYAWMRQQLPPCPRELSMAGEQQ